MFIEGTRSEAFLIYLLTTLRVDTDFQDGVQYQTKQHIGTFKFERVD